MQELLQRQVFLRQERQHTLLPASITSELGFKRIGVDACAACRIEVVDLLIFVFFEVGVF
jgi:hypothetical protein